MVLNYQSRISLLIFVMLAGIPWPTDVMANVSDWDCSQPGTGKEWDCGTSSSNGSRLAGEGSGVAADAPAPASGGEQTVGADGTAQPVVPETGAGKQDGENAEKPAVAGAPAEEARVADPPPKGWNCTPEDDEGGDHGWKCSLSGHDPKGRKRQVAENGKQPENWAESKTITQEDEWRFEHMMSLLPANPWARSCAPKVGKSRPKPMTEFILSPAEKLAREQAAVEIDSDHFELIDGEVANFSGEATMVKADQKLWGDYITRNLKTNSINTHGNVAYQEKGLTLTSDTGFLEGGTDRGVFRNSQFILPAVPGRGTSRLTHLDSDTLSRYENFTYTTCPPGNQDWLFHAEKAKVNKDTGTATVQNAWFEFEDIPLFYTPYMSFPTDNRRMSGFLSPSFGGSSTSGAITRVPYYFNLAPNYDYTVQPAYFSKRGFLLQNEFRYMGEITRGRILGDIMPHDQLTNTTRGKLNFLNDTRFGENVVSHTDINWLSDYNYPSQLGSPLNVTDYRNVPSRSFINYSTSSFGSFRAAATYFQTIDPTIPKDQYPYFYLPKLSHNYSTNIGGTSLNFDNLAQFDYFQSAGTGMTTGQRLAFRPNLSYPMQTSAGFIKPSATLAFNQYQLQNPEYWSSAQQSAGVTNASSKASQNFTVPILSVDSGTYFDRDTSVGENSMLHTLEPRLFYVYIPTVNQSGIPAFDTTAYDNTYYQLFRENRFAGYDRVGDANDLTAAVTTRLIDQSTGLERLRATIGNQAYFKNREVTVSGVPPDIYAQSFSNIVTDFGSAITESWSTYTGGQYNASYGQIVRGQAGITYNNRQNQILNLGYRYRRNQTTNSCDPNDPNNGCLNLTDASFRLPVLAGWYAIGRWEYSLLNRITLESFFGLEKETCCFRFTLLGRHYINSIQPVTAGQPYGTGEANNTVYMQLELKGLTTLGDEVDQFLERSVTGYRFRDY